MQSMVIIDINTIPHLKMRVIECVGFNIPLNT